MSGEYFYNDISLRNRKKWDYENRTIRNYTSVGDSFDCKDYRISEFEVVGENTDFIQVHYMITTTVNNEENKDFAGTFHISTTWKRFGEKFKVIFNMDRALLV